MPAHTCWQSFLLLLLLLRTCGAGNAVLRRLRACGRQVGVLRGAAAVAWTQPLACKASHWGEVRLSSKCKMYTNRTTCTHNEPTWSVNTVSPDTFMPDFKVPAARRGTDCPACYASLGRLQAGMTCNTHNSCNSRNTSAPQDTPTNAAQEHAPGGRGLMPDASLGVEGEEVAGLDEWGDPECVAMPMRRAASCCCSVRGEFTCEQSPGPGAGTGVAMLVRPKHLSKRELCGRAP